MIRCPITYEPCDCGKYSMKGLKLLSKNLSHLKDFPHTRKEQLEFALQMNDKLSIQGVQPKLSLVLNTKKELFEIVEHGGTFILKPPHHTYEELPQNEDLTMKLASLIGIEIPIHGMIYNLDGSLSYFIKRFDRSVKKQKIAVEDFSQLLGFDRDTKYESSMEQVIGVIEKHCTFPIIEKLKLFRLVLFNFLIGNEDMHLKNFSLIRRKDLVELSPAYDLLNTSIVLRSKEEIALPIRGKKSRLTKFDLFTYFGQERLGLSVDQLENEFSNIKQARKSWDSLIDSSFLSAEMKRIYSALLLSRWDRLV